LRPYETEKSRRIRRRSPIANPMSIRSTQKLETAYFVSVPDCDRHHHSSNEVAYVPPISKAVAPEELCLSFCVLNRLATRVLCMKAIFQPGPRFSKNADSSHSWSFVPEEGGARVVLANERTPEGLVPLTSCVQNLKELRFVVKVV
jgi:hypothetical protein